MRLHIYISIFLVTLTCKYQIRNAEILEKDLQFMVMRSKNDIPEDRFVKLQTQGKEMFREREILQIEKTASPDHLDFQKNNYGVFMSKSAELSEAEKIFRELTFKNTTNIIPLLNLSRLYYLIDEYDTLKLLYKNYLEYLKYDNKNIEYLIQCFSGLQRFDEKVMLLDVMSESQGLEVKASERLAEHFLTVRKYKLAESYLEKILSVNPYNQRALHLSAFLFAEQEKWRDALMFALSLEKENKSYPELNYILVKCYYELGEIQNAMQKANNAGEADKKNFEFLKLWKQVIISNDSKSSLTPLKKYFVELKKGGLQVSEADFFSAESSAGREIHHEYFRGY